MSVLVGKLGSAVVSSDLGALGESESETAFLRDFLAGAASAASAVAALSCDALLTTLFGGAESAALRFDWDLAGDEVADVEVDGAACLTSVPVAVRLEARLAAVLVGVAAFIVLNLLYRAENMYLRISLALPAQRLSSECERMRTRTRRRKHSTSISTLD